MSSESENKISVLLHTINDCQETIRFVENKTGFCIAVFSGHLAFLYSIVDDLVKKNDIFPIWYWVLLAVLLTSHCLFVKIAFDIVQPRFSPKSNLDIDSSSIPKLSLFLPNVYMSTFDSLILSESKLESSYIENLSIWKSSTADILMEGLVYDLHKVSYIRNIKITKLKQLVRLTVGSSFLLIILLVFTYLIDPAISR